MLIGCGALILQGRNVLLGQRVQAPEAKLWSIPGGRVEPDETPDETIRREVLEELGVQCSPTAYLGAFVYQCPDEDFRAFSLAYTVRLDQPWKGQVSSEHSRVQWFTLDDLPKNLSAPARFAIARNEAQGQRGIARDARIRVSHPSVVLLQPFFPFADRESLSIPLGLASLHAVLQKAGIGVRTYDCSIPTEYISFCEEFAGLEPRVVGVQFHSVMSFDWAKRACRFIRRKLPGTFIVGGGELATARSAELLHARYVDAIVHGEAELTFPELVGAVIRDGEIRHVAGIEFLDAAGRTTMTDARPVIRDLDQLPAAEISDFRWREYGQWTLFTSRGCPFRCMYCSSAAYWKHSIRYQGPSRMLKDMQRLVTDFGANDIYIADDTFTLDKRRVHDFISLLKGTGNSVRWACLTRVDCVDADLLEAMHSGGCVQISFGLETAVQRTLDLLQKRATVEDAKRVLAFCHRIGIRTRVSIIIGLPGESRDDVLQTLQFLLQNTPNEVQLYGLTPHDGTALFSSLEPLGVRVVEPDTALWSRNVLNPVCETNELSRAQIVDLARQFVADLEAIGYIYLDETMARRKIRADKTVATNFSPVQSIGPV
jgi:anaerobic magnesium-protoporphyrin IX monomethyl ester cyclase